MRLRMNFVIEKGVNWRDGNGKLIPTADEVVVVPTKP